MKIKNLSSITDFGIISENEEFKEKNYKKVPITAEKIKKKNVNSSVKLRQKDYIKQSKKALSESTRNLPLQNSLSQVIPDKTLSDNQTHLKLKKNITSKIKEMSKNSLTPNLLVKNISFLNDTISKSNSKANKFIINSNLNLNLNKIGNNLDKRVFSTLNLTTINTNNSSYRTPNPNTTKNKGKFSQNFDNLPKINLNLSKSITKTSSIEVDLKNNFKTFNCVQGNKKPDFLNKNFTEEKCTKDLKLQFFNNNICNIPIYDGIVDINSIVDIYHEIIFDNLEIILKKNKISFIQTQKFKFRCSKTGITFDIEFFILENSFLTYLKFKKTQGEFINFVKLSSIILEQIKSLKNT